MLSNTQYAEPYQGLSKVKALQVQIRIAAQLLADAYNTADSLCDEIGDMNYILALDALGEEAMELAGHLDFIDELKDSNAL